MKFPPFFSSTRARGPTLVGTAGLHVTDFLIHLFSYVSFIKNRVALHFATNIKEIRICIKECIYFDLIPRCYHISVQENQHFQYRLQKLSIILFLTVWIDPCERSIKINALSFPVNVTSLKDYRVTNVTQFHQNAKQAFIFYMLYFFLIIWIKAKFLNNQLL